MILTAYHDEAGTHAGSPVTVMTGIMGTANQWRRFETAATKIKARYGFKVFHTTDFKTKSGEFLGWNPHKRLALLGDLAEVANDKSFMEGVTFVLSNREYDEFYKGSVRYFRQDSKYGLCFRNCMLHLILYAVDRLGTHKKFPETKLNFVLESGAKGADDAKRIFDETKKEMQEMGLNLLGGLTFDLKGDHDALWLPDFVAHMNFLQGDLEPVQPSEPYPHDHLPRDRGALTLLRFREGGLADLKQRLIEQLRAKRIAKKRRPSSPTSGAAPASGQPA